MNRFSFKELCGDKNKSVLLNLKNRNENTTLVRDSIELIYDSTSQIIFRETTISCSGQLMLN
jgi:hypothetical protein